MTGIEEAIVLAHKELIRTELAYCRAAAQYAEFIYRHSHTPEDKIKWRDTFNKIVENHRQAQNRAIELGIEAGAPLYHIPTPEVANGNE